MNADAQPGETPEAAQLAATRALTAEMEATRKQIVRSTRLLGHLFAMVLEAVKD